MSQCQSCWEKSNVDLRVEKTPSLREQLTQAHANDAKLMPELRDVLYMPEAAKLPTYFYKRSGILMRKWRPATASSDEEWQVSQQIGAPKCFHNNVLSLAHSSTLDGHLCRCQPHLQKGFIPAWTK